MSHEERTKEFQRLKDLLEPSFPLMPVVRPESSTDMDVDVETTDTANETTTEPETLRESTPKSTKETLTARKCFVAPLTPPTQLAFEPQTPPTSEPDTEPQPSPATTRSTRNSDQRATPQPTPNQPDLHLSDNILTVSRDLPNFPYNIRQNERFFETLNKIGLAINNLKDFSLSPSLDDHLFATFLPQLTTRLEPLMSTLTEQKFDIFTNLKQLSIYLIDHFIFDIFNAIKYILTDQLTKYENNATRMKNLRNIINIKYINNPNDPELVAEYKRRKATQIHYNSAIREMMHTINHVATLKTTIIYEDPLFDCLEAMKVHMLCAVNEIISKNALTEDEKLKDIFINAIM